MILHYEMVSETLHPVLSELMRVDALSRFRLVGGTSLALQLGHRSSIDIDLFAGGHTPAPRELANILTEHFNEQIKIIHILQHGVSASIRNIKVDLYDWKVPFANDVITVDGLRLASIEDIFAFKCEAILGRKVEKDFVDIAEISLHRLFEQLLSTFQQRYPQYNKSAVLAILLKPDVFNRDTSIKYTKGKSWDVYCSHMMQIIVNYEKEMEMKKEAEIKNRDERLQKILEQKRNK